MAGARGEVEISNCIVILNGPNLNLLGEREPDVYGRETLADIDTYCSNHLAKTPFTLDFRQSNSEGVLVDWIQEVRNCAGLIINPAAYTHTSVALRDALATLTAPKIEIHLSNIAARDEFRRHSYVSPVCNGVISGFGPLGYSLALDALIRLIEKHREN